MNALSDPRAYLSNQEKRAEQMKRIGFEENDISTQGIIVTANSGAGGSGSAVAGIVAAASGAPGAAGADGSMLPSSGKSAVATGKPKVPGLAGMGSKRPEEKEEVKFEPITADTLKQEKGYMKVRPINKNILDDSKVSVFSQATKKHAKELEGLRKKHQKERTNVQKNQVSAFDKLMKSKGK